MVGVGHRWFAPGSIEREPESASAAAARAADTDDESYALCCEALGRERHARAARRDLGARSSRSTAKHDAVISAADAELRRGRRCQHGRSLRIDGAAHLPPPSNPKPCADSTD